MFTNMNLKTIQMFNLNTRKLLKAGYVFLRTQYCPECNVECNYVIKYSIEFGSWRIYERFKTKAAMNRSVRELMEENKYLLDQETL